MSKILSLTVIGCLLFTIVKSQGVAINSDGSAPDTSAMLDVKSSNKGVLIPRLALTGIHDSATIHFPKTSLLVYNTATTGTDSLSVAPGFYYWSVNRWLPLGGFNYVLQKNLNVNGHRISPDGSDNGLWLIGTQTTLGQDAYAHADHSIAMGRQAETFGTYSVAIGNYTHATGLSSVSIGSSTTAGADYACAIGGNTWVDRTATGGLALGMATYVGGVSGMATGYNTWSSGTAAIAMGFGTSAYGDYSTAIGRYSIAGQPYSFAIGDSANTNGTHSFALGDTVDANGANSFAIGSYTTAGGNNGFALGNHVIANGANCFAIGNYVTTNYLGSFIIGDRSTTNIATSNSTNQMTMRFDNGYRLFTNSATTVGVMLAGGGNAWSTISDVHKKENFEPVDGETFLQKISAMPLTTWNYKGQDPGANRHYGPMAQDFYAAFGKDEYGTIGNDTTINQADFDGINFIGIQALEKRTSDLKNVNTQLKEENARLEADVKKLKDQLDNLTKLVMTLSAKQ
ncbi:MAG TPA: tail fiber domain-containing protein [Puia sp.]|nr:tail fiber domain-containing protein [Puia sp.]